MVNKKEPQLKSKVEYVTIDDEHKGQRVDNYLHHFWKGMPKSRIYRLLRKGEIRVNKKRISPDYHLDKGDCLRLPPVYLQEKATQAPATSQTLKLLQQRILYEDDNFIVLNKPSGMSVHIGSTVRIGIIEAFRQLYPKLKNLELAHRLDSDTSGCLILVKRKSILREVHQLIKEGKVHKVYWALTKGKWKKEELKVEASLRKHYTQNRKFLVKIDPEGKKALTTFKVIRNYVGASLVEATLFTGRTHQIRVHTNSRSHPIAGDDRYGDADFNKKTRDYGLKRMFLHAHSIDFVLPSLNQHIKVTAPLDLELEKVLARFSSNNL